MESYPAIKGKKKSLIHKMEWLNLKKHAEKKKPEAQELYNTLIHLYEILQ